MPLPSIEAFERAGLLAWPGLSVQWDGAWVRRAAGGYTKRANSLQCLDPADGERAAARLGEACAWMLAQGIAPVVRTTPLQSPELTGVLDEQGWGEIDPSHLYAMPLATSEPAGEGQCLPILDPAFLRAQQLLQGYDDATLASLRALLTAMAVPACGVVLYRDGQPAASGLMALADGICITGNVVTDPAHRRQGLAGAMMRRGLAWGQEHGAVFAALNVQADNGAAKALYRALGYQHQYDYCYRIAPGEPL